MRNKNNCIRLMEKLESKLQTLNFILSRPDANVNEFKKVIDESKDLIQDVKSFLDREQETM
tara:strand:+ start:505 stop:687 length:183 start_codon:yes stop_codon:yes gene_type:complete